MDSGKTDNERELTSTMGNVLSVSIRDEKNDTSGSDATPTSSTDANTTTSSSQIVSDDPISSTSSDIVEQNKSKILEASTQNSAEAMDEPDKSSVDPDSDLLEMSISSVSRERITEDVEDLVHDLESLLGESTDSFNIPTKRKEDQKALSAKPRKSQSPGKQGDVLSSGESVSNKEETVQNCDTEERPSTETTNSAKAEDNSLRTEASEVTDKNEVFRSSNIEGTNETINESVGEPAVRLESSEVENKENVCENVPDRDKELPISSTLEPETSSTADNVSQEDKSDTSANEAVQSEALEDTENVIEAKETLTEQGCTIEELPDTEEDADASEVVHQSVIIEEYEERTYIVEKDPQADDYVEITEVTSDSEANESVDKEENYTVKTIEEDTFVTIEDTVVTIDDAGVTIEEDNVATIEKHTVVTTKEDTAVIIEEHTAVTIEEHTAVTAEDNAVTIEEDTVVTIEADTVVTIEDNAVTIEEDTVVTIEDTVAVLKDDKVDVKVAILDPKAKEYSAKVEERSTAEKSQDIVNEVAEPVAQEEEDGTVRTIDTKEPASERATEDESLVKEVATVDKTTYVEGEAKRNEAVPESEMADAAADESRGKMEVEHKVEASVITNEEPAEEVIIEKVEDLVTQQEEVLSIEPTEVAPEASPSDSNVQKEEFEKTEGAETACPVESILRNTKTEIVESVVNECKEAEPQQKVAELAAENSHVTDISDDEEDNVEKEIAPDNTIENAQNEEISEDIESDAVKEIENVPNTPDVINPNADDTKMVATVASDQESDNVERIEDIKLSKNKATTNVDESESQANIPESSEIEVDQEIVSESVPDVEMAEVTPDTKDSLPNQSEVASMEASTESEIIDSTVVEGAPLPANDEVSPLESTTQGIQTSAETLNTEVKTAAKPTTEIMQSVDTEVPLAAEVVIPNAEGDEEKIDDNPVSANENEKASTEVKENCGGQGEEAVPEQIPLVEEGAEDEKQEVIDKSNGIISTPQPEISADSEATVDEDVTVVESVESADSTVLSEDISIVTHEVTDVSSLDNNSLKPIENSHNSIQEVLMEEDKQEQEIERVETAVVEINEELVIQDDESAEIEEVIEDNEAVVVQDDETENTLDDNVIEVSDDDSKTMEAEAVPFFTSGGDSDSEDTVPTLVLEPDEINPSPEPSGVEKGTSELDELILTVDSTNEAEVSDSLPGIGEILNDRESVDEENIETILAVASLQNTDTTQVPEPAVEPQLSDKEKREMEALRKAVESITEATSIDYEDVVSVSEQAKSIPQHLQEIIPEPEVVELIDGSELNSKSKQEDKAEDTVASVEVITGIDEEKPVQSLVNNSEVPTDTKIDENHTTSKQELTGTEATQHIQPDTSDDAVPDSSEGVSASEATKTEKESKAKVNERPKRHKRSFVDSKLEELSINVDVPERDKPYSPKVTIKPIKVPDEEVSTTSNSDSEIGKGSIKMTITKQSDKMHSVLKIYESENSESAQEQDEPIPKLIIKPKMQQVEQQHSPKMSTRSSKQMYSPTSSTQRSMSPRITIKPVLKPEKAEAVTPLKIKIKPDESAKKHSPKLTIKPIAKPEEECRENVQSPRKVTIKPLVKPLEEPEQVQSPRITIKPIPKPEPERLNVKLLKKQEDDDLDVDRERSSPKIIIKPLIKPQEPETVLIEADDEVKERIVLKINKGNLPSPTKESKKREHPPDDEKSEKLAKITVKFSKGGGHPHIVQQTEETNKRVHEESSTTEKVKKQKTENESPVLTRSKHKEVPLEQFTSDSPKAKQREVESHVVETRSKHTHPVMDSPIEVKRVKLREAPETSLSRPNNDSGDEVKILESKIDSPIVISEDSRSQDSGSCVIIEDVKDPLGSIPMFDISAIQETPPPIKLDSASSTPSTASTPTPRKRGRPRKVPIVVREDFKEQEDPKSEASNKQEEAQPVHESGRPKRSCRGQSVRATLGIKPRKPRGPGRGRGGKRGMGTRVVPMKPERLSK